MERAACDGSTPPQDHEAVHGGGPLRLVPVCRLAHRGDRLEVTLVAPMRPLRRSVIKRATPALLGHLLGTHRAALAGSGDGRPAAGATVPVSATQYLLHAVHLLISGHLVELLAGQPRVALDLDGWLLPLLPIETAHGAGGPALFETTQCFRLPARPLPPPLRRRTFRLEQLPASTEPGAGDGLHALHLERDLVAAAHRTAWPAQPGARPLHRVLHLAGHEPRLPSGVLHHDEHAHVVLSGCDSLPRTLPPGVGSAVGSLWPVDDQLSATVMAAYHGRLAAGVGPLEALRQTQLLHRALPPEVWASYVYLGHPD